MTRSRCASRDLFAWRCPRSPAAQFPCLQAQRLWRRFAPQPTPSARYCHGRRRHRHAFAGHAAAQAFEDRGIHHLRDRSTDRRTNHLQPSGPRHGLMHLLAGVLFAGCVHQPAPSPAEPSLPATRRVTVVHAGTDRLLLCQAVRDGWAEPTALDDARELHLDLPPGRYAVQLGDDPSRRVPLPLPPAELGFVPPTELRIDVSPWPASAAGWCWIPPGPGLRGDDLGVGQEDERPLSTPTTGGFWLAATETTNAQFVAFLNALDRDAVDARWLDLDGAKCRVHWDPTRGAYGTDAPSLPIVTVAWAGATAYCDWLTRTTGREHRLPTETEWEKAARGPGSRVYAYGDTCTTAAANQESGRLREVGSFPPNEFGLFDMTGNAFEWCADAYARRTYDGDPGPGANANANAAPRVLRGGSFVLDGIFCRNAMRMRLRPDVRADDVGFRVLRAPVDTLPLPNQPPAGDSR